MTTFGLLSSYREGPLAIAAVRDLLKCCDRVLILEGPAGDSHDVGEPSVFWPGRKQPPNVIVREGAYKTDAAKRTELIRWAQRLAPGPAWAVVLDADEIMPWAEYLPDYIRHSDSRGDPGGVLLKVVFDDGQVFEQRNRCYRLDQIDRYLLSGVQLLLKSGITWACPIAPASQGPMHGEPHILHRSHLRPVKRGDPSLRMSKQELEAFHADPAMRL